LAVLALLAVAAAGLGYKFVLPWWQRQPPRPSGAELRVHVLDVGQGDSILIVSPTGKTVLVDAGDFGRDKVVREALGRLGVQQLDYFVATHAHPDHIGGAAEVLKNVKVLNVIDNGVEPDELTEEKARAANANAKGGRKTPKPAPTPRPARQSAPVRTNQLPTVRAYADYLDAVKQSGAQHATAAPGQPIDLGGGALLTVLAPVPPPFTPEQMRGGGNAPNANSVVLRLEYGHFSMLFAGDAEAQTEERILRGGTDLASTVLKVAHHGSKYATSEDFLRRVKPQAAVISTSEANRYGHPNGDLLARLRSAGARVFRTDMQGEITITTKGDDFAYSQVKTARQAEGDIYTGREATKDDSERSGFITYGDFGPSPKQKKK
jgi:beta-lactamase superfamily II metal-dependent hydrolase